MRVAACYESGPCDAVVGARTSAALCARSLRDMARLVIPAMLLVLLGACQSAEPIRTDVAFETAPWQFGRTTGTRIETEHYEIFTTLEDRVLIEALPGFVEGCYQHYRSLVPPVRQPAARMQVYLFATRGQWEAFTRQFTGPRAATFLRVRNGGYSEQGVSVIEYVAHQVTFPLFAHEGFHQYLHHHVSSEVPAWLNEGLAVECEGQRWGLKGLKEFDPWYNPARRNALSAALISDRLHSLPKLLRTHAGRVIDGSSQSVATYYAQLWALVLFLREGEGGRYRPGFERLLSELGQPGIEQRITVDPEVVRAGPGWLGEALFRHYISDDLPRVEAEYVAFMRARFLGAR